VRGSCSEGQVKWSALGKIEITEADLLQNPASAPDVEVDFQELVG
jgi:hypothetical protein